MQDELVQLEEQLARSDSWEFAEGVQARLFSRRKDFAEGSTSYRKELIPKINQKLNEYGTLNLKDIREFDMLKTC